jgi:hypothetical protein
MATRALHVAGEKKEAFSAQDMVYFTMANDIKYPGFRFMQILIGFRKLRDL